MRDQRGVADDIYKNYDDHEDLDPLCCCEYVDLNSERNHILGCCCNCVDLDLACERCITCKSVSMNHCHKMLLLFQDRLRFPWNGGAKQISVLSIAPLFTLPLCLYTAALSLQCSVAIFVLMPLFLGLAHFRVQRSMYSTKFFFVWAMWSACFLWILFQSTVPMMELLPEENIAFIVLLVLTVFFFYKTRKIGQKYVELNRAVNLADDCEEEQDEDDSSSLMKNDLADVENGQNNRGVCQYCHKQVPPRTYHCFVCQCCIFERDHHNLWLDCCVGGPNRKFFLLGCIFGLLTLALGSNLSLTSICHPFLILNVLGVHILLPDDCSDVYEQYDVSVCFVAAIYSILIAFYLIVVLCYQIVFISKGMTTTEWQAKNTKVGVHRNVLQNWKNFLCN